MGNRSSNSAPPPPPPPPSMPAANFANPAPIQSSINPPSFPIPQALIAQPVFSNSGTAMPRIPGNQNTPPSHYRRTRQCYWSSTNTYTPCT